MPFLAIGGLACYTAAGAEGDGASVVYGRVAHPEGAIVLQYWYFYYDNTYSYAYPASNLIWQAHEGDWANSTSSSRRTRSRSSSATASTVAASDGTGQRLLRSVRIRWSMWPPVARELLLG